MDKMSGHNDGVEDDETPSIMDAFVDHKRILASYIARFFLRPEDIEDILQESFVQTFEAANNRPIASPKSYLFMTARHLIYRQLRRQARDLTKEISEVDERFLKDQQAPLDHQVHDRRKLEVFIAAAESLPAQCRRVFVMRKFYGMSHQEIAKQLDISTSTVERHITNAIKRCRTFMDKQGYGADDVSVVSAGKKASRQEND